MQRKMAYDGKGITADYSSGNWKRNGDDKSGYRKRKNFNVLQYSEGSGFSDDDDFANDVSRRNFFGPDVKAMAQPKTPSIPPFPKKEETYEEDLEKFFEEHYKPFRSKYGGVSVGTWTHVKRGKYLGDLAQVVHVNEFQRKATVKLLPRIDLQAMSNKISGGFTGNTYTSPAPRLITSSELDAYRTRVRSSLDPDTGDLYEVFDGMKLKDGYVFKKLSLDSLMFSNCQPSEAELLKFTHGNKEGSNEHTNKKQTTNTDNVGGGSDMENSFEVLDLVIHGRKAFGVVIGKEKDDRIKVLEEGSEQPVVVTIEARLLKKAAFDKNLRTLDQHKNIISINDAVRVLEGPLKDKQGIVKQTYKGVVFFHDENEDEHCGYFCAKAQICQKIQISADLYKGKGGKSGHGTDATVRGESSECGPPPGVTQAVGFKGLPEASFVEKLRSGAQEWAGLMEEAATRCLGRVSVEDQLRGALVELQSSKERVSAVEAERDTLRNSLKQEREKMVSVFTRLLDTEFQLKEDLRIWCERYKADV